ELDGGPRIDLAALARRGGAAETDDTARLISGGTLAAFVVDLAIRDDTRGTRGLDQLMYFLQKRTPETGYRPGTFWDQVTVALDLPADALRVLAERGSLSLEAGLSRAGLRLVERDERRRALGARLEVGTNGQFVIAGVRSASTAASAGLREGDRVLKINETPISPAAAVATRYALTAYIRDAATGAPVTFEILRDGETRTLRGTVRESRSRRVTIEEISSASSAALLVRSSLFRPQEGGR
ncbi:MAG: PDZ domain-containing protein, partial [Gemmatimonadota bacterium]